MRPIIINNCAPIIYITPVRSRSRATAATVTISSSCTVLDRRSNGVHTYTVATHAMLPCSVFHVPHVHLCCRGTTNLDCDNSVILSLFLDNPD